MKESDSCKETELFPNLCCQNRPQQLNCRSAFFNAVTPLKGPWSQPFSNFTHQICHLSFYEEDKARGIESGVLHCNHNIILLVRSKTRLLPHGDVRIKEQAFLLDAVHTNPQPQNAPEDRDLC